jgi:transposase
LSKEIDQLRGEIEELRRELAYREQLDAERQATIATLQEQLEAVKEQNALLQKALFAPRRERFIPSPDQKLLFEPLLVDGDEANSGAHPLEQAEAAPHAPRRKRRPRRRRFEFPQCLPIKRFEYPLDEEDRLCPCGCGLRAVIHELITRQLEYTPPSAYVAEHVRYTYGCPQGREGELIVTSEKPPNVNDKGVLGPSVIAWLAQSKFERHLPLYRLQEELELASQMWFNRSVLSGSLVRPAKRLQPLVDLIRDQILNSFYVRVDETTARVLRPGTGKT